MAKRTFSLLLLLCFGLVHSEEFSISLAPEGKYNVSWSFTETSPTSEVTFTVACFTTGWVGLGLSPNGAMTGADLIVAWVDSEGMGHLKDMHAVGNQLPLVDRSQDVTLVSASEHNGFTTVTFRRKLSTCDKKEDREIQTSTTRLIYAFGSRDPVNNELSGSDYHGAVSRGGKSVYLLDPASHAPDDSLPGDLQHYDIRVSDNHMKPEDTIYYCSFHDPPPVDTKHHVISIEPIITEGNEALVHHMVLYGCWGITEKHLRNNNKTEGVCGTAEMPEFTSACINIQFAWGIGGTKFNFPEHTGYPIGAKDGSIPEYYMLQTHYDNPQLLDTWVDSSGFRLTYTADLRVQDAGILQTGAVYGVAVPPHPNRFRVQAFCGGNCTSQWIPPKGVQLFGYILHAHLLGVKIQVDWYSRDGKSKETIAQDDTYDFNYQENRLFRKEKKLMPGDTLKVTCTYTDLSRKVATYGGLATTDEMCVAFFNYYPSQNVSLCQSLPALSVDSNHAFFREFSLNPPLDQSGYNNLSVIDEVSNWSENTVRLLQDSFEKSDHYTSCKKTYIEPYEHNLVPISTELFPKPEVADDKHCTSELTEEVFEDKMFRKVSTKAPLVGVNSHVKDNSATVNSFNMQLGLVAILCSLFK